MAAKSAYLVLALSVCAVTVQSARILAYFPVPSISHQVVFRPLTQELARRGHDVVVITPDPAFPPGHTPDNLTEIDLHDMSYAIWREKIMNKDVTRGNTDDIITQVFKILQATNEVFEKQFLSEEVQKIINNKTEKFDLLLLESFVRASIGLTHTFKIPTISVSSLSAVGNTYDVFGVPSNPILLYPTPLRQRLFNLTIWDKINELVNHYLFEYYIARPMEEENNVLAKKLFGPDTPNLRDLDKNIDMAFLNVHPMWEFNRPVPPGIVFMGGIHQKPTKELPQDLKSYLDSSKHGVIYISFGTNVSPSQLPPEKIQMMVKVFSRLPYDVLWKWDRDVLPGRTANIRISKWLPQSDLLKHPKMKLFITQGGLQSTDEAITAGVPLLGVPMLGDQWFNVEHYLYFKVGLRMDMDSATEDIFEEKIISLIGDESYRKNMVRLRAMMADQPQSPLERAVWWTEHVLRHGGAAHLRAPAANLSWPEYLDLELLLVLALIVFSVITVLGFSIRLLLRCICQSIFRSSEMKTKKH